MFVSIKGARTGEHLKMTASAVGKTQQSVFPDGDDEVYSDMHLQQPEMSLNLAYSESDLHTFAGD